MAIKIAHNSIQILKNKTGGGGGGGGGGGSISQTDLVLWLKADAGVNLNGTEVAGWNDQSATGYNLTPFYSGDSYRLEAIASNSDFNNQPTLYHDDYYGSPALEGAAFSSAFSPGTNPPLQPTNDNLTVFYVGELATIPWSGYYGGSHLYCGPYQGWGFGGDAGPGKFGFYYNKGIAGSSDGPGIILTTAFPGYSSQANILKKKIMAVGRADGSTGQMTFKLNGATIGTQSIPALTDNSGNGYRPSNKINIGAYTYAGQTTAEVIVYNRALTDAEIIAIESYITTKYGAFTP